jgi:opacity protein-like surface antigen
MKKIMILVFSGAFSMMAFGVNAQNFEKGNWFMNANASQLNLSVSKSPLEGYSLVSFNINAGTGYFLTDKFAVEAGLGLNYSKFEDSDANSSLGFNAGVRYYPVDNLFARFGYSGSVKKDADMSSSLQVKVGYDWFLSDKVFFEPAVFYTNSLDKYGSQNFGLSLGAGVKF